MRGGGVKHLEGDRKFALMNFPFDVSDKTRQEDGNFHLNFHHVGSGGSGVISKDADK